MRDQDDDTKVSTDPISQVQPAPSELTSPEGTHPPGRADQQVSLPGTPFGAILPARPRPVLPTRDAAYVPHWDQFLSNEEYHEHRDHVSSTGVRRALESPAKFLEHCMPDAPRVASDAFRLGTLVHAAVLEPDSLSRRLCVMPDLGDMRSAKNRQLRQDWLAGLPAGAVACTMEEFRRAAGMVRAILAHGEARALFEGAGVSEVSGFYSDPATGLLCRIRPDRIRADLGVLADLKTTQNAERRAFAAAIWRYRYDVQMAMYCEGARHITGQAVDVPAVIAVESAPPYEVAFYVLDDDAMAVGHRDMRRALDAIARGLDSGVWPARHVSVENIGLPSYAFNEENLT